MTEGQYQEQYGIDPPAPGQPSPNEEIWTTRDGRKILVGEMDEDHVRNALRMCIRVMRKRQAQLAELKRTLKPLLDDYHAMRKERRLRMEQRLDQFPDDDVWGDNDSTQGGD